MSTYNVHVHTISPNISLTSSRISTNNNILLIFYVLSFCLIEKCPGPEASREFRQPRIPFVLAASTSSPTTKSVDEESDDTDYLMLEAELQNLMERVTMLEAGQAHILEAQRSIIRNQEEIFGRLLRWSKDWDQMLQSAILAVNFPPYLRNGTQYGHQTFTVGQSNHCSNRKIMYGHTH